MKWRMTALATLMLVPTLFGQPGRLLTDEQANAAIAAAKQPQWTSMFVEAKGRFAAYYSVLLQGPVGRTMDLAREAFESYKPLAASDVPADVRAREVTFTVIKHGGSDSIKNVSIKNIVVMPSGATSRDAAIQPLGRPAISSGAKGASGREARPRTWKPGFTAATASGDPLFYRFAEDALPPGEFQIIIATTAGDERYTVKAEERERIR
jgi:hypothetical protein